MSLTDVTCPDCDGYLHTDDLLERECVTPGCGATLPASLYEEENIRAFYTPGSVMEEIDDDD